MTAITTINAITPKATPAVEMTLMIEMKVDLRFAFK
jgi:hypothetical protein